MYQAICTKCGKRILVPTDEIDYICPLCEAEMVVQPIRGCRSCVED